MGPHLDGKYTILWILWSWHHRSSNWNWRNDSLVFQNPPVIPWVWRCEFGTPKGRTSSGGVLGVQSWHLLSFGGPGCLAIWNNKKDLILRRTSYIRYLRFWHPPPKFNSLPLKNAGWKTIVSFWDGLFSGAMFSFWRVNMSVILLMVKEHLWLPVEIDPLNKPVEIMEHYAMSSWESNGTPHNADPNK